jgi:hypothetical protein
MSRQGLLDRARRAKEADMSGRCTVTRFTPAQLNPTTLKLIDTNPNDDLQYDGPFRIKSPSSAVLAVDANGQLLTTQQLLLCLPLQRAAGIRVDDQVRIVDGGLNPTLAGRTFRIAGTYAESYASEARLPIVSLS